MTAALDPRMQSLARSASALLALLCVQVQQQCQALGVERVLYMTREGVLFKAYHERFFETHGTGPAAELLRVSRLSTFAASLHGQGVAGLSRLFSQYPQAGWAQLRASLGEPPSDDPGPPGTGPALQAALQADAGRCAWLLARAEQRQAELAAYLARHHGAAMQEGHLLVVDIGWRGTIQDNLAHAFASLHWQGVYVGLYPYLNPQPPNATKHGVLFNPQDSAGMPGGNLMPIEYLFHQPIATVAGYRDGQPLPLGPSEADDAFSLGFQAAVLADAGARAAQWGHACAAPARQACLQQWHQEALEFWRGCQHMPLPLYEALCRYAHEETFGLGQVVNLAGSISPRAALRSLFSRHHRALFVQHLGSLPLDLRHEPGVGPWLRAWLNMRRLLHWLRSGPRH